MSINLISELNSPETLALLTDFKTLMTDVIAFTSLWLAAAWLFKIKFIKLSISQLFDTLLCAFNHAIPHTEFEKLKHSPISTIVYAYHNCHRTLKMTHLGQLALATSKNVAKLTTHFLKFVILLNL